MSSSLYILFSFCLLSLLTHPTFSKTTCKSLKFSSNTTFENCNDLPTLNAVLHWSYNPSNSSLSMAFTASPSQPEGWVAWALNPTDTGMAGAQALLAHKAKSTGLVTVETYDIRSYSNITQGPISYDVTSVSAVDSSGVITIFATWALPKGASTVNHIWQVGPVVNGDVGKHAFEPANLGSKMKLSLIANGPNSGPAGAPNGSPSGSPSSGQIEAPAPGSNDAGDRLVSGVLALGAIVVSLLV